MVYFSNEFLEFFKELRENNRTEWFHANKSRYEKVVKKPFEHFISDLIATIRQIDSEIEITPKEAIFRINRDIRFSNDKSPYKSHVSAIIRPTKDNKMMYPGYYIELSNEGLGIYGGIYQPDKELLYKVRFHIMENLDRFAKIINAKDFKSKFGEIQGEKNKKIQSEFKDLAEKFPLIMNKQFYYHAELKPEIIISDKLLPELMKYFNAAMPLKEFLVEAYR